MAGLQRKVNHVLATIRIPFKCPYSLIFLGTIREAGNVPFEKVISGHAPVILSSLPQAA